MKRAALLACIALPLAAQERWSQPYRWSVAAVIAANAADAATSYRRGYEANPLVRSADGQFGKRGLAIKAGATAGSLTAQYLVLRKHPNQRKLATLVNLSTSAGLAILAARNARQ